MASPALPHPAWLLAAVLASALATAGWIRLARRGNVVDAPGQRRLHDQPTPRGGGIAMALVLLAAWAWILSTGPDFGKAMLALGTALAAATGLLDDLLPVPSGVKLLGQALAATAIAVALPWPGLAPPVAIAVSGFAVLVVLNFWNFMDGANGIVAVQTGVVAAAFAVVASDPALVVLALATVAACLGFLPFNLPRARVFMGDAGSHVLGATVAILGLWTLRRGDCRPAQVAVLLSAFAIDAGLTLAKRIVQGRRFWRAHREHLYQWAVRRGHSHARVCLAYAAWAILSASVALGWGARGPTEAVVAALAVGLAGATTWVVLRRHWLKRETRMDAST
jgi:UDP-N-acetylmuramyl pentapeptide phosphotransferase/UDP-N-acetylglucosamine-1-phosphate transferase